MMKGLVRSTGAQRILEYRLPIILASTCIGIAAERLNWGLGVSVALIVLVQGLLVALKQV
jgi:hypothetical protein